MTSRADPRRTNAQPQPHPEEDESKARRARKTLTAKARKIWDKADLDIPTVKLMIKYVGWCCYRAQLICNRGGVAPTIGIAM